MEAGEGTETGWEWLPRQGGWEEQEALRAEYAARGGISKGTRNRGIQVGQSLLLQWEGAWTASFK